MTARPCSPVPAITLAMDLQSFMEIQYSDKDNQLKYVHQTSWGMTTRLMAASSWYGDDNGLVLPPRIAPVQVMIVPIQQSKEGVLEKAG